MDERAGRAIFYLAGSVLVAAGCAFAVAWWAGLVAFGALLIWGAVLDRPRRKAA